MKKALALLCVCAISVGLNAANLTKSGEGYDRVKWDSDIETVKAKYPGLKEIKWYSNNIKIFMLEAKKDTTVFYFYENKLRFVDGNDGKAERLFCNTRSYNINNQCYREFNSLLNEEKTARAMMLINMFKQGKSQWGLSVEDVKGVYRGVRDIEMSDDYWGKDRVISIDTLFEVRGGGFGVSGDQFQVDSKIASTIERDLGIIKFGTTIGLKPLDRKSRDLGINDPYELDVIFSFYQNKLYRIDLRSIFSGSFVDIVDNFLSELPSNSNVFKRYGKQQSNILFDRYNRACNAGFITLVNPTVEKQIWAKKGLTLPVYGYEKVEWGADIQAVMNNYANLKEISNADSSFGKREFVQLEISESMIRRSFKFYQNKLYSVSTLYKDARKELLAEKFTLTFGSDVFEYLRFEQRNQINPETFMKIVGADMEQQELQRQREHKQKTGKYITNADLAVGANAELNYLGAVLELAATTKVFAEAIYGDPDVEYEVDRKIESEKKNIKQRQADDAHKKRLEALDR